MSNSLSKKNVGIIAVFGGWIVKEKGKWRTTNFKEADDSFALGDRLRVVAAARLYEQSKKANSKVAIWVSGGKGKLAKIPDAPTVASVIKNELETLGIPSVSIEMDEHSGTTYEQLYQLNRLFTKKKKSGDIALISNEYHLPRIRAMIEYAPDLQQLKEHLQNGSLAVVSAESVLSGNKEWKAVIKKAYQSTAMKKRIASENLGVTDIEQGTYTYGSGNDQIIAIRKAKPKDARFLFDLRNDDDVRRASFSTDPVSWEQHTRWFQKKLAGNDSVIFIVEIVGVSAGQVRFDMREDMEADINIAISRDFRGKGYGARMIKKASEQFFAAFPKIRKIHAFIKPTNEASLKTFARAGFRRIGNALVKGEQCVDMMFIR